MNFDLNEEEFGHFTDLMTESLRVKTHFELFLWLQGKLQIFLPHDVMIAAWGDFSLGLIYFDVVSPLPGLRTSKIPNEKLIPLLRRLFSYWCEHSRTPYTLNFENGIFHETDLDDEHLTSAFKEMKHALVHAIKDCRGRHDCLYVLIGSSHSMPPKSRKMLEILLPYIDCSLRQLEPLPDQVPEQVTQKEELEEEIIGTLSLREKEIMDWVKNGKTNQEIGMILDISSFTVKNHLQRIFKKLDVLNRAQAVTKFRQMYPKDKE